MRLSIEELKEILEVAQSEDLDDSILIDWDEEYMYLKLWLNEHAWKKFRKILHQKSEGDL